MRREVYRRRSGALVILTWRGVPNPERQADGSHAYRRCDDGECWARPTWYVAVTLEAPGPDPDHWEAAVAHGRRVGAYLCRHHADLMRRGARRIS